MTPSPPNPPRPTTKEQFKSFIDRLIYVLVTMHCSSRMVNPFAGQVIMRIQAIAHRLRSLTERLEAGTYKPRKQPAPRKTPIVGRPWKPGKLPTRRGWLAELIGPADAPGLRGWLHQMLQKPENIAAIEAAPSELGGEFRSLCWMLKLDPPPVLVATRPKRVRPSRAKPAPPPAPAETPEQPAISWKKPRGSISNRLYRHYRPPGSRPPRKTA